MDIEYSDKYYDDVYEYRHVRIPKYLVARMPDHLMSEKEWRELGLQMSPGWIHYMKHNPEPHMLLFRRYKSWIWKKKQEWECNCFLFHLITLLSKKLAYTFKRKCHVLFKYTFLGNNILYLLLYLQVKYMSIILRT